VSHDYKIFWKSQMIAALQKFFRLPCPERRLLLEAIFLLGIYRIALKVLSFKRLTHSMVRYHNAEPLPAVSREQETKARQIGEAVERAGRHTPWKSACLVRACTAAKMMRRRKIPGSVCIGVQKETYEPRDIEAHAWTMCAEHCITGAQERNGFTQISSFKWDMA